MHSNDVYTTKTPYPIRFLTPLQQPIHSYIPATFIHIRTRTHNTGTYIYIFLHFQKFHVRIIQKKTTRAEVIYFSDTTHSFCENLCFMGFIQRNLKKKRMEL